MSSLVHRTSLFRWIILACFVFISGAFNLAFAASDIIVKAKVDTNQIRIGEQFRLDLTATTKANTEISFPLLPDTFNHIELVGRGPIDTLPGITPITLHQTYILTSFDSGFFVIPPLPFLSREIKQPITDTAFTEALLIGVKTLAIDTTREIKDIKSTMDAPFPWMDYLPYFLIGWVILMIVIYIIYKLGKRKKKAVEVAVVPDRPAHELAIDELKRIEAEKLWQNGLLKQYHSSVADTLRLYIERRFMINALEQTTDEILKNFGHSIVGDSEKNKLKYVLSLADTVKFAKAEPILTENEQSIRYAYDFVNGTIPFEKPVEEKKEVAV